jgi:hypothetical protein
MKRLALGVWRSLVCCFPELQWLSKTVTDFLELGDYVACAGQWNVRRTVCPFRVEAFSCWCLSDLGLLLWSRHLCGCWWVRSGLLTRGWMSRLQWALCEGGTNSYCVTLLRSGAFLLPSIAAHLMIDMGGEWVLESYLYQLLIVG